MKTFPLVTLVLCSFGLYSCQQAPSKTIQNQPSLPENWLIHDVNSKTEQENTQVQSDEQVHPKTDQTVDQILKAQADAVKQGAGQATAPTTRLPDDRPKDYTPWHLGYMVTDLSVSLSGWIGSLLKKGTPSVTLIWRKQHYSSQPVGEQERGAALSLTSATTRHEIESELEPAIQASLATGKIDDEETFRDHLLNAALDFQSIASALEQTNVNTWWVSRFRMDLAVDGSGKITPVTSVGAELKIRLEWHRIMTPHRPSRLSSRSLAGVNGFEEKIVEFANQISEDIEDLSDGAENTLGSGYQAYGYRVGLGISDTGDIGIASTTATLTGQLYFSRDVKKPVVHHSFTREGTVKLVGSQSGVSRLDRNRFRKGLQKALRIGRFFARHANWISQSSAWKIYELRTAFDLTMGGKTGLSRVNGAGTCEINFYNENF